MSIKLSHEQIQALLDASESDSELILLGQQIGAKALLTVCAVLGGSKGCEAYITSPQRLVEKLTCEIRDKEIQAVYNPHNGSAEALAAKWGITRSRVCQIALEAAREVGA